MKVVSADEQCRLALRVYRRTRSVTKTVRELGFSGRWSLYKWLRESKPARSGVCCGVRVLSFSMERVLLQARGVSGAFAKPPVITGESVSFLQK